MTRSDELKAILGKARRYVNSARMLRREQDYDSAVSRLYYAMFYCAEALLLARGFTFSSHRAVISGFAQHFVKAGLLDNKYYNWLKSVVCFICTSQWTVGPPVPAGVSTEQSSA